MSSIEICLLNLLLGTTLVVAGVPAAAQSTQPERLRILVVHDVELVIIQSNHEGEIVDAFQHRMDDVAGAVVNPAGLSLHSVALPDVVKAMPFPVVETHISNLGARDEIHRNSIIKPAVRASMMGLGWRSYTAGLRALVEIVREERSKGTGKEESRK
jgi:3-dehydroquinate dehydratase-2